MKCEKTSRRVLRVDACAHFGRRPGIRKPVSSYAAATFVPLDTHLPSSSPGTDYTHGTVVDRDDDAVFRCPIRRDAPSRRSALNRSCQIARRTPTLVRAATFQPPHVCACRHGDEHGTVKTPKQRRQAYMRKKEGRDWFAREGPLVSG